MDVTITKLCKFFGKECENCHLPTFYASINLLTGNKTCVICSRRAMLGAFLIKIFARKFSKSISFKNGNIVEIFTRNKQIQKLFYNYVKGVSYFGLIEPQIPYSPIMVIWAVTSKCNLNCTHCYQPKTQKDLSTPDMKRIIDKIAEMGTNIIALSGGEPLLRKDIFDLISYIHDKGLLVYLASNGSLIDEETAMKLKNIGLDYIQISLDGSKKTHEKIRNAEGLWEKTIDGVRKSIAANIYTSIGTTVMRANYLEIPYLLDKCKELGVNRFELIDFIPAKCASHIDEELPLLEKKKLVSWIIDNWKKSVEENYIEITYKDCCFARSVIESQYEALTSKFFGVCAPLFALNTLDMKGLKDGIIHNGQMSPFLTGCEAGRYAIFIDIDGTITPCPYMTLPIGDAIKDNILGLWQKNNVFKEIRNQDMLFGRCKKCEYWWICQGCRARIYEKTGNYLEDEESCYFNAYK